MRIQDKDDKWHKYRPFVETVKGGKAVIYATDAGKELKRETLARYRVLKQRTLLIWISVPK